MSHSRQFVDQVASGESSDAKETIENALSAMAFEALETRKQEIASTMFGGVNEDIEQLDELTPFGFNSKTGRYSGKHFHVYHKPTGKVVDWDLTVAAAKKKVEKLGSDHAYANRTHTRNGFYVGPEFGGVNEDIEQLDEVSLKKASQLYTGRWKKAFDPDQPQDHTDPYNDKALGKWEKTHNAISKKFGEKGLNRIERLNKTLSTKHPDPYLKHD